MTELFSPESISILPNTLLQIRRGKRDNLGIIFCITLLKCIMLPVIRTILLRRF